MLLDERLDARLVRRADHRIDQLAALEEQQRRNAADAVPADTAGFSSTFNLPITALPSSSVATASTCGAIMRHGPHHSAQKSTSTGVDDFSTACWKLSSVNV